MFASGLIAAIVGVRILLSFARTIGGAALGGTAEISRALIEVVEALFGMLLAGVVIPLISMFFGGCAIQLPYPAIRFGQRQHINFKEVGMFFAFATNVFQISHG